VVSISETEPRKPFQRGGDQSRFCRPSSRFECLGVSFPGGLPITVGFVTASNAGESKSGGDRRLQGFEPGVRRCVQLACVAPLTGYLLQKAVSVIRKNSARAVTDIVRCRGSLPK
jgi:hypothetical protein